MGKSKREYREDEQYGDSSHTSDSSGSSSNSNSSGSGSEESNSSERERKRKRVKKSSKQRKARQESPGEYEPRHEDHKHRSRKHKHHHRKHKHKHRHHRHHRGGEEEHYHARRGSSRDRSEVRRSREDDRRGRERVEEEKAEKERKVKREERKNRERYENRQPDQEEGSSSRERDGRRLAEDQGGRRDRREGPREIQAENGRSRGNVEEARAGVKMNAEDNVQEEEEVQKPNMGLSGKLTEDTNTYNGVVIKYSQPPEARKPKRRWRWYIFKGEEDLPFLPLHRQSAYLIGRDRKVADIPTDHPSCSKQHAVLQYRLVTYNREDGTKGRTVKPYILDLESANGTYVNNRRIEPRRYVELLEKDVVKFGYSSREYILLHEGSKGEDQNAPDTGIDLSPVSLLRS
nr:FHA domain-containing protein DDL-like [Penaeus vannamei]